MARLWTQYLWLLQCRFARLALATIALALTLNATPVAAANQPQQRYAELPGVRLWFTDTGGDGPAVILLHANTGTSEMWQLQADALSAAGYRVIAFDRRGWGRSLASPATGPQPGTVAEDLENLVKHLNIGRFHLVGVAGGTFVALDYTALHPERVISLVAGASTGSLTDPAEEAYRARILMPGFPAFAARYRELSPSYIGSNPQGTERWESIVAKARQPGAPIQPLLSPNNYAKIEKITARTLVMAGDADLWSPPGLMRQWGARMPNAEWTLVREAAHSIPWEQPEVFNRRVLQFLQGCRGLDIRTMTRSVVTAGPDCIID